jgi:hypothetical protein
MRETIHALDLIASESDMCLCCRDCVGCKQCITFRCIMRMVAWPNVPAVDPHHMVVDELASFLDWLVSEWPKCILDVQLCQQLLAAASAGLVCLSDFLHCATRSTFRFLLEGRQAAHTDPASANKCHTRCFEWN